jgi:tetratricopeptide (TPR) repeat protein
MGHDRRHSKGTSVEDLLGRTRDLAAEGKTDEALEILGRVASREPLSVDALRLRGTLLLERGRVAEALADLDRAIRLLPSCAACYFERGMIEMCSARAQAAIEDFSSCLSLDPEFAPALASRAALLFRMQRYEEALDDVTRAAAVRPTNDRDIHNRGLVLAGLGRYREALRAYEHALALNQRSGGTHNNLAWLLATSTDPSIRDGARALEHARRAVELGESASWMDTLAAAHAECGDFKAAVRAERKAYELSGRRTKAFLRRIGIYRRGMSYAAWLELKKRRDAAPD